MRELYSDFGVVLVCSRCLQFNQFSVPLSLTNMNNVHNTEITVSVLFVANRQGNTLKIVCSGAADYGRLVQTNVK